MKLSVCVFRVLLCVGVFRHNVVFSVTTAGLPPGPVAGGGGGQRFLDALWRLFTCC